MPTTTRTKQQINENTPRDAMTEEELDAIGELDPGEMFDGDYDEDGNEIDDPTMYPGRRCIAPNGDILDDDGKVIGNIDAEPTQAEIDEILANSAYEIGTLAKSRKRNVKHSDAFVEKLTKAQQHATCADLILKYLCRPDSRGKGRDAKVFGVTSLQAKHVVKDEPSGRVILRFQGRHNMRNQFVIDDPQVAANLLTARAAADGPSGSLFPAITYRSLIRYAHSLGVEELYDLRTLGATIRARKYVEGLKAPKTARSFTTKWLHVGARASELLCESRSVALRSFIVPDVFESWYDGLPKGERAIVDKKDWWPWR